MKVLVFGSNGYLGSNIINYFSKIDTIADSTTDITNLKTVSEKIKETHPDAVINAAAKVNEDLAETDIDYWDEMVKVNILGAINCLKGCQLNKIKLIHIKTPFEVAPIDDYSLSKIAVSSFINAEKYKNMTLKILPGWFFGGVNSKQFDKLLIRSIKEKIPLGITNNSECTPVYMPDFCKSLEETIIRDTLGVKIISATEKSTRYEFAKCVAGVMGKTMEELNWTENNDYPEKAKRPKNWCIFGDLPSFRERIGDFLKMEGF